MSIAKVMELGLSHESVMLFSWRRKCSVFWMTAALKQLSPGSAGCPLSGGPRPTSQSCALLITKSSWQERGALHPLPSLYPSSTIFRLLGFSEPSFQFHLMKQSEADLLPCSVPSPSAPESPCFLEDVCLSFISFTDIEKLDFSLELEVFHRDFHSQTVFCLQLQWC